MKKLIITIVSLMIISGFLSQQNLNPKHIEIVRGPYGTPHIFANTDQEAAYGLAWAHAEDDFKTIQETFLPVKGLLGIYSGKEGAKLDYIVHLLRCKQTVEDHYHELSKEVLKVLQGYVDGINAYAMAHPDEVLVKKAFPITVEEYLIGYNLVIHFFSDTGDMLRDLFGNKIAPLKEVAFQTTGSNGFAFRRKKTTDNKTYLNVNTHQPLEGPFAWYEAHLVSKEGWNFLGGLFPGAPFPFIGTNEHLGWTHTYNFPDLIDVYQLEMHPKKKHTYKFDNEWIELEKTKVKLRAKLKLGITIPVKKKVLWSLYGPVVENDSGTFSFHVNALENISSIDQWYHMGKAANFNEFKQALSIMGVPRFNVVYADRMDNIYYLSNAQLPVRDTAYNWEELLPGNTSKTLTDAYHTIDELPQVYNPSSGYIFNTNNSPYNCTHSSDNPNESDYPTTYSFMEDINNRSIRFEQMIAEYDQISYEDFMRIKYDQQYPTPIFCPFEVNGVFHLKASEYPHLKELITMFQQWDKKADVNNLGSAQWYIYYKHLKRSVNRLKLDYELPIPDSVIVTSLEHTQNYFIENFGKLAVVHGDFQKHVRGDTELPVPGLLDMIAATSCNKYKDAKVKAVSGESYIMLIRYSDADVEIETVLPYGISNHPESPHYTDQMELYVNQQRKKMTLDKKLIYQTAKKIYHPE